jgi:RimJ/RimL family protein N-acetyltransferase
MNATIRTQRLQLRPWHEDDAVPALPIFGDPTVMALTGGALDSERLQRFVQRRIEEQERGVLGLQPLVESSTGAFVGASGLQLLAGGPDVEIGWMLARASWGRGYATEIASAVLDYGLQTLGLPRIVATIDPRNAASIAVVNRLAMRFARVIRVYKRDMLCYESI